MADGLRGACDEDDVAAWVDRTRDLDDQIDEAWATLRQARESSRLNLRRAARGLRSSDLFEEILRGNEQAVAETRSMARTLGHSVAAVNEWDPRFRDRWLGLLREAGEAIAVPDSARVARVRTALGALADELSNDSLPGRHWPEYGALLSNLRNVVVAMDRVAAANPLVVPRYAARRDRLVRG